MCFLFWEVEDYHTYFVSATEDGVSVWAHNNDYGTNEEESTASSPGRELLHITPSGRKIYVYDKAVGTEGVLVRPGGKGETPLTSGANGPSSGASGVPKMNGRIKSHVESHVVVIMKSEGLNEATLYINRIPCQKSNNPKDFTLGCNEALPFELNPGQTLRIIGPDGFDQTYKGLPADDPARAVRKPSRVKPEVIPRPNWPVL